MMKVEMGGPMHILRVSAAAIFVSSCATAPPMLWLRTDGQSTADNPILQQQFLVDRTICIGEMQKANVSGVVVANGSLAGAVAAQNRANAVDDVLRGCMAEKGYVLVQADQAEAQRAQFAAVAAAKKAQEAAQAKQSPTYPQRAAK
jgi:hypothetical protein